MKNRIEPPILLSRLLVFVLAMSVVVLFALGITLKNMFPLNRPQIFFLTAQLRDNVEVRIIEMPTDDAYADRYVRAFIREYIRARNEILPESKIMNKKWNAKDGLVKIWSTDDVYKTFSGTSTVNSIRRHGVQNLALSCTVDFINSEPIKYLKQEQLYQIKLRYNCANNAGPLSTKDYTIALRLVSGDIEKIKWTDRIENPLGLRVSEYKITDGGLDPLDSFVINK